MPELPEVETVRRGLERHLLGSKVKRVTIRQHKLRYPISPRLEQRLKGLTLLSVSRRAKYLLLNFPPHHLLLHLGMSGSVRIVSTGEAKRPHDHFDILFTDGNLLRFNDPRRFGCILLVDGLASEHKLLRHLGVEPLAADFNSAYLYQATRNRKQSIKQLLMDTRVVVGIGNIYANEALFYAGIRPTIRAGKISLKRISALVEAIVQVLHEAVQQGGTTLQNFVNSDGKPGYFSQQLMVYGRGGESCRRCRKPLRAIVQGQRSTVFCTNCQT